MELNKILIESDQTVLHQYVKGVENLLKKRYGNGVNKLLETLSTSDKDSKRMQFLILMALNKEPSFQSFFIKKDEESTVKYERFFIDLRQITERFLNFKITKQEYLHQCKEHWIIS